MHYIKVGNVVHSHFENKSWVVAVFLAYLEAVVLQKCKYIILLLFKTQP